MTPTPPIARVAVVDIDMPFGQMIWFMLKWAIAAIPAIGILAVLAAVVTGLVAGLSTAVIRTSGARSAPASEARIATRAGILQGLSYAQVVDLLGPPASQGPGQLIYHTKTDEVFTVFLEDDHVKRSEPPTQALDQLQRK